MGGPIAASRKGQQGRGMKIVASREAADEQ